MQRVADFTVNSVSSSFTSGKIFHLPITKLVLRSEFPRPVIDSFQKKIPRIRTDLNRFSPLEMRMLVDHGYEVAWALLQPLVRGSSPALPDALALTDIADKSISTTAKKLDRARSRKLGLFDVRDWVSFALASYLLAIMSVASFPYFYVAKKAALGDLFKSARIEVPFVTNRRSDNAGKFGTERDTQVSSGRAVVYVPSVHRLGYLEIPRSSWLFGTASDDAFSLISIRGQSGMLPRSIDFQGKTLVYLHGYNVSFETALMKAAQIAFDVAYPGYCIAFSWPSKGTVFDYEYDQESAMFSRQGFSDFIQSLESPSTKIDVVAEGLGGQVLIDGLENHPLPEPANSLRPFGELILVSPDLDFDGIRAGLSRLVQLADRITLILSTDSPRAARDLYGGHAPFLFSGATTILVNVNDQDFNKAITMAIAAAVRGEAFTQNRFLRRRSDGLWEWLSD
jgi:hypothetical protein